MAAKAGRREKKERRESTLLSDWQGEGTSCGVLDVVDVTLSFLFVFCNEFSLLKYKGATCYMPQIDV